MHLHIENSSASSPLSHVHEPQLEQARARHPDLADRVRVTIGWDGATLDAVLPTADFMIASRPPRENLPSRAPRLTWIQTTGAGIDHLLPLDWLPEQVTLTNNSGPHGPKCEDFCMMALLALGTRLPQFTHQQQKRVWASAFTPVIAGKTCLVIGFGDLGQAAGRAAKRLGLTVVAVTRSGKGEGPCDTLLPVSQLDAALPAADFVVVAAPLTPDTRHLLDRARLARLRSTAGLVNISRAPLVDHEALVEMLEQDRLGGAILDVQDPEPLPADSPLWATKNLILTPHVSSDAPNYVETLLDAWFANFRRLIAGDPLKNVVNRTLGY
jgi:phosphoglycerate dehydrogenase-like enzyme